MSAALPKPSGGLTITPKQFQRSRAWARHDAYTNAIRSGSAPAARCNVAVYFNRAKRRWMLCYERRATIIHETGSAQSVNYPKPFYFWQGPGGGYLPFSTTRVLSWLRDHHASNWKKWPDTLFGENALEAEHDDFKAEADERAKLREIYERCNVRGVLDSLYGYSGGNEPNKGSKFHPLDSTLYPAEYQAALMKELNDGPPTTGESSSGADAGREARERHVEQETRDDGPGGDAAG